MASNEHIRNLIESAGYAGISQGEAAQDAAWRTEVERMIEEKDQCEKAYRDGWKVALQSLLIRMEATR